MSVRTKKNKNQTLIRPLFAFRRPPIPYAFQRRHRACDPPWSEVKGRCLLEKPVSQATFLWAYGMSLESMTSWAWFRLQKMFYIPWNEWSRVDMTIAFKILPIFYSKEVFHNARFFAFWQNKIPHLGSKHVIHAWSWMKWGQCLLSFLGW